LNHAALAPPPVAMLYFVLSPGMSYSSNTASALQLSHLCSPFVA
jgi:hypothetical protein